MNGSSGKLSQFDVQAAHSTHARSSVSMRYRWLRPCPIPGNRREGHPAAPPPRSRSKHAACHYAGAIYMYGGKHGGVAYSDLWRYDIASEVWSRVDTLGDRPPALQEHTIVAYKNKLYLFGGDFCYGSSTDTPLWVLCLESLTWSRPQMNSEVMTPCSRRAHTAVIHNGAMHVYGGYIDLRGSSSEFWTFDLEYYQWHLSHASKPGETPGEDGPGGRHSHSALVHRDDMWVVGGMTDLVDRSDIWCWSFVSRFWSRIKLRRGLVPDLRGHTACRVGSVMLVFGGTSRGALQSDVWSFHLETCVWQKVTCQGTTPEPRTNHCAVTIVTPDGISRGSHTSLPDVIQPSCSDITSIGCFQNRVIPINSENDAVPDLVDVMNNSRTMVAPSRGRAVYPAIGQSKRTYITSLRDNHYMSSENDGSRNGISIMLHEMSPTKSMRGVDNPTFVAEFNIALHQTEFVDGLRRIRAVSRNDLVVVDIDDGDSENGSRERTDSRAALLKNVEGHGVVEVASQTDSMETEKSTDDLDENNVRRKDKCWFRPRSAESNKFVSNYDISPSNRVHICQSNLSRSTQDRGFDSGGSICSDSAYADDQSVSTYHTTSQSVTMNQTHSQSAVTVCDRTVSADSGVFEKHRLPREAEKMLIDAPSGVEKFSVYSTMTGGASYILVFGGRMQESQNIETRSIEMVCLTID